MDMPTDLSAEHLPDLLTLSSLAGWNQTVQDWQMMLACGRGWGIVSKSEQNRGGQVVASAVIQPYAPDRGWISMVLVHPDYRRQGLATVLMNKSIRVLHEMRLTPWLDATDAGREVYRQLGFEDRWRFQRWARDASGLKHSSTQLDLASASLARAELIPMRGQDLPEVVALDAKHFGAARESMIGDLFHRSPGLALTVQNDAAITGFILGRDGRMATQLGPLVADSAASASALLAAIKAKVSGPVFIDLPDQHAQALEWLESAGFKPQRGFTRMALPSGGSGDYAPLPAYLLAGPELG